MIFGHAAQGGRAARAALDLPHLSPADLIRITVGVRTVVPLTGWSARMHDRLQGTARFVVRKDQARQSGTSAAWVRFKLAEGLFPRGDGPVFLLQRTRGFGVP